MYKNANSKCTNLAKSPVRSILHTGGGKMNERKDILERAKHLMKENVTQFLLLVHKCGKGVCIFAKDKNTPLYKKRLLNYVAR